MITSTSLGGIMVRMDRESVGKKKRLSAPQIRRNVCAGDFILLRILQGEEDNVRSAHRMAVVVRRRPFRRA